MELKDKVDHAIQALKLFERKDEPYYLCYSGGKDDSTGNWTSGEAVMRWWVGDDPMQMTWEDYLKFQEEESDTMKQYVW